MDAVKEAVLEQKIDDLALRFEQAEERNRAEHLEIRAETRGLRAEIGDLDARLRGEIGDLGAELRGEIQHLNRTLILCFASLATSVVGAAGAAIVANAL